MLYCSPAARTQASPAPAAQAGIQVFERFVSVEVSTGEHRQWHEARGASGTQAAVFPPEQAGGGGQQLPTESRQPAAHLSLTHTAPFLSPPTCVLCFSSSMRRSLSAMASSRPATSRCRAATSRCSPSMVPCSCRRSASALLRRGGGSDSDGSWLEQTLYHAGGHLL